MDKTKFDDLNRIILKIFYAYNNVICAYFKHIRKHSFLIIVTCYFIIYIYIYILNISAGGTERVIF